MKYPKINLKEVRQQARQFQASYPRLLLVFYCKYSLDSDFYGALSLLDEGHSWTVDFLSFLGSVNLLFPIAVGYKLHYLAGALFTINL